MDDKPLEILPYGRTAEEQARIDRKHESGRHGVRGCLALAVAVVMAIVYVAGYVAARFTVH